MNKVYGLDIKTVSSTPSDRWTSGQLPNWLLYGCCQYGNGRTIAVKRSKKSENDMCIRTQAEVYAHMYHIPATRIMEYLRPEDKPRFYDEGELWNL